MARFTVNEREIIYKLFDISGGYILCDLYRKTGKNKTWTQKLIFESTNIDIYTDDDYKFLSQQKAIEKIFDTREPLEVANLIQSFCDYIKLNEKEYLRAYSRWCYEDLFYDLLEKVEKIISKLKETVSTSQLPALNIAGLRNLENDLKQKLEKQEYDLAIDRLHTYSLFFLEALCKENNITPNRDPKGHIMFDDMISQLQRKFENNSLLNNFEKETIKNSKIMLQKYNEVRNNQSYAHPNKVIENARARYVVNNIIILLNFLDKISKESVKYEKYCHCENSSGYTSHTCNNCGWAVCNDCGKEIEGTYTEDIYPF